MSPLLPRRSRHADLLVTLLLLSSLLTIGCSDGGIGPGGSIDFLIGVWDAEQLVMTSKANPSISPELISLGFTFFLTVEPPDLYTAALSFERNTNAESGFIAIEGDEIVFLPSGAPISRSKFTYAAARLTLIGDTEFPFLPGNPEPAVARFELVKR